MESNGAAAMNANEQPSQPEAPKCPVCGQVNHDPFGPPVCFRCRLAQLNREEAAARQSFRYGRNKWRSGARSSGYRHSA